MLVWRQMAKEEEKQKCLMTFTLNYTWIALTSLGSFGGVLQLLGINGRTLLEDIFPQFPLGRGIGVGRGVGVPETRQIDSKVLFTSLHTPTVWLLVYMAISEIPGIVGYTKCQSWLSALRNPLCIILASSKTSKMWWFLLTFSLETPREYRIKKSILRYLIFHCPPQFSLFLTDEKKQSHSAWV